MKKTVLLLFSIVFAGSIFCQTATVTWALTSNGNPSITGNIAATAVTTGPGRSDYGGIGAMSHTGDGVRSQNWNRAAYTGFSITSQYFNRDYYQYTVTPTAGNTFNLSSVTLEASASASSASWFVYYSLDGFTTYTQLGTTRNLTSFTGLNIDVPAGTTLTLRIYGMDLLSSSTYFRNRNVVISGTTSSGCSAPDQPASISGTATLCAGGNQTYSITNDPNATSYTWTLPAGWSGTSTTNTINATAGTNGGTISVIANNACGNSVPQTLTVNTSTIPNQPAAISGTATICENGAGTYSVTNDPNATSYTWTLPAGWSGTSTTNTINATAGTNGGTISVTANNACGSSTQQTLTVSTSTIPNQPAVLSGTATICENGTGTYSVTNDPNATSYTWTLPAGWSGTSTTNTINATAGTNGGTISVIVNNACGNSAPQTLTVNTSTIPNQPAAISGTATICENGAGTYSVTNDPNATSYTWTLPAGWNGTSATNTINATAGTNGGTISVTANNACGNSVPQTLTVNTSTSPNQLAAISGTATICENGAGTYSVTNDPNATSYTWTLPAGWNGTSTTNNINATAGTNGGTISVTANNACGSSIQQTFNVTVNAVDNTVSVDGIVLTSNQSGASYQWLDCSNGNAPITNAAEQSFTPSQNGSYAVEVTLNGCSEISSCIAINSVGIESVTYGDLLNVYPNPGEGWYTISSETAFNAASVTVYSASGQLVMRRENIFGNEVKIDLTHQPGGVYVVNLNNREQQTHVRIIKL